MDYTLRKCKFNDFDFIFELKKQCFKWYVEKIYGWDEKIQYDLTKVEMKENISYMNIIQFENKDIGLFTFHYDQNDELCIGMFAILPNYQNKGIGTKILSDIINNNLNRRIYLKTYKENPARNLYLKVGFKKYDETKTHWLMER